MIFDNIMLFILWNIKNHFNNIDTAKDVFATHVAQIHNNSIIALNIINMNIFIRIRNKSVCEYVTYCGYYGKHNNSLE